jgi:hypothetical protein
VVTGVDDQRRWATDDRNRLRCRGLLEKAALYGIGDDFTDLADLVGARRAERSITFAAVESQSSPAGAAAE